MTNFPNVMKAFKDCFQATVVDKTPKLGPHQRALEWTIPYYTAEMGPNPRIIRKPVVSRCYQLFGFFPELGKKRTSESNQVLRLLTQIRSNKTWNRRAVSQSENDFKIVHLNGVLSTVTKAKYEATLRMWEAELDQIAAGRPTPDTTLDQEAFFLAFGRWPQDGEIEAKTVPPFRRKRRSAWLW